jgi:hypothetical protein
VAWVITSGDVSAALGVAFASPTDEAWAELAAASATALAAELPLADDPAAEPRMRHGATMLAVWYYKRRPQGTVEPGFEFTPTSDEVTAFYQALGMGRNQPLDVLG